jgi:1-acyl-sn-glycerol-3-phosphate acyltransferase
MLIGVPQKIMLRYIIKRELLVDPCLDIVGHRLPNYFVRRGSGESAKETEAIGQLMHDLSPGQGVLMYPEGTRFTPAKRERVLKRLEASGDRDALRRAKDMLHVLPPRLGGSLALLERNEGTDAVFCVHTGLESTTSIRQLWRGSLVGSRVRVRFWVVPFEEIPKGREALSEWLWAEWAKANAFLEASKEKEV